MSGAADVIVTLSGGGGVDKQLCYVSAANTVSAADADASEATATVIGVGTATATAIKVTGIATCVADTAINAGDKVYLSTANTGRVTKAAGTGFPATGWLTYIGVAITTAAAQGNDVSVVLNIQPPIAL